MKTKDDFHRFRTVAGTIISRIRLEQIKELEQLVDRNQNPNCGGTLDDDPEREKKWNAINSYLQALDNLTIAFTEIQEIFYGKRNR